MCVRMNVYDRVGQRPTDSGSDMPADMVGHTTSFYWLMRAWRG